MFQKNGEWDESSHTGIRGTFIVMTVRAIFLLMTTLYYYAFPFFGYTSYYARVRALYYVKKRVLFYIYV